VTAYDPSQWTNLFLGELGAAAALVGLLFVAISINLQRILAYAWLPGRAAETLVLLVNVLLVASCGLIPGQTARALGWEVLAIGGAVWLGVLLGQLRARRHYTGDQHATWFGVRVLITQVGTLPFVIGGISLIAGRGGGLYWIVAAVLAAIVAALENSWVLLVEIVR
jgi:modulator of FtsH protease